LAYKFPKTGKELDKAVQVFESLSSHGAIKGSVACLNGSVLQIKNHLSRETGKVKAYFQDIIKLHMITNLGLFILPFLHLEEPMTLQH